MNEKQIAILKQNLTLKDGQPVTTSRQVAESFDKRHDHVLRDIDNLECSRDFRLLNFGEMAHFRANPVTGGQSESRAYAMTKNGFLFLAMGWTGKKAAMLREGYLAAFDLMEAELRSGMAITRDELTTRLMAVVFEAGKAGHFADFIPELIRYRRLGLTHKEIGILFAMPTRTVGNWLDKVVAAGVELPRVCQRGPAADSPSPAGADRQLPLFPVEGRA